MLILKKWEKNVKAFSYLTPKNEPRIGIEYNKREYNFTWCWEVFKDIHSSGRGPQLSFLQIMVELEYFSAATFKEVFDVIREFRPLKDFRIKEDVRYQVPIGRPQKIICIGRNYTAHAAEHGHQPPDEPMFFAKAVSSMIPHQANIIIPAGIGAVEHEVELGVIIGKQAKRISENDAYDYIAGYTIVNDVSARMMQKEDITKGHPWFRSKSFDTFCPIGPYLVPNDAIKNPHHLDISLKVNGDIKQQSNTSKMIFKIPQLIAYISKYLTLEPGDIIATGTPEGVSPIEDGDIIEADIENFGTLRNFVFQENS